MPEKIAIVTDSGSDINLDFVKDLPIFKLPLRVIVDGKESNDLEVSNRAIFEAMKTQKVTTSLPSPEEIEQLFIKLKQTGYTHVIALCISSGLSGTYNTLKLLAEDFTDLKITVIDTKNISIASGFSAIEAAEMVMDGVPYDQIIEHIYATFENKRVFFTVGSLEYLRQGGRIGLVSGTVADMLQIKPIISCNSEGIYYTVQKTRGYRKSIQLMLNLAKDFVGTTPDFDVVLLNAQSEQDFNLIAADFQAMFPQVKNIPVTEITPALAIHTGPEAVGIAINLRPKKTVE